MLRRTKKEVRPDLPTAVYSEIVVEPGSLHLADLESAFSSYIGNPDGWEVLHQDMREEMNELDKALAARPERMVEERLEILASMIPHTARLRRYIGLLKVQPVVDLVKYELDNGVQKIVLFAIHKDVIENLRVGLQAYGPVTLYGATPPEKRDRHLKRFHDNHKCRVFIGNIHASGVAIDLAAASEVLFVESDWVPQNNAQAAARVDGPGQKSTIHVRFAALAGSIDEHIQRTLRRKTRELSKIFDAPGGDTSSP